MSPIYTPGKLLLRKTWQPMDSDAAAYITAVEAADTAAGQSGGLEEKTKIAIDSFVLGCKADGIWSAIKASCILAGAKTRQGALVPLRNEFDIVNNIQPANPQAFNFVDGDYDRKTGLVGDGSTKYVDSNRNNNADLQNSNHNALWFSTSSLASTQLHMGSGSGGASGENASPLIFSSQVYVRNRSSSATSIGVAAPLGLFGVARNSESSYQYRMNKTTVAITRTSQAASNANITIFGPFNFSTARIAFYSIGESLDLAKLDARVTDLITAIGAAF